MITKAVIPVRAGSQRIKNKNIKPFADSNLLEIKINQMKRIKGLDGIIVNSNSEEMLEIAKSLDVETYKRDDYYSSSTISANDLYSNIADSTNADVIIYTHVTNPLITDETINDIIQKYFERTDFDSLTTVTPIKDFLWLNNQAINYDVNNKPRSQDLPNIVALNHAINIIPKTIMKERKDLMGYKPYFYVLSSIEAVDIDNEIDFEFAEFLYKKYRMNS